MTVQHINNALVQVTGTEPDHEAQPAGDARWRWLGERGTLVHDSDSELHGEGDLVRRDAAATGGGRFSLAVTLYNQSFCIPRLILHNLWATTGERHAGGCGARPARQQLLHPNAGVTGRSLHSARLQLLSCPPGGGTTCY